jgi:hypothetical protein
MGEEIQDLDPGLLKLGKIQGLDLRLSPTVNTNTVDLGPTPWLFPGLSVLAGLLSPPPSQCLACSHLRLELYPPPCFPVFGTIVHSWRDFCLEINRQGLC